MYSGWSLVLLVFILGMPFLLSTLSVAMIIAMGSWGGEGINSFPTDEGPDVVPGAIAVTSARPPASEIQTGITGDATADTDNVSAVQGYCLLHKMSEDTKLDIHETISSPDSGDTGFNEDSL